MIAAAAGDCIAADPPPPPQAVIANAATTAAAACRAARIAAIQEVFIALVSVHAQVQAARHAPPGPRLGAMLLKQNYITKLVLSLNELCNYICM
ncbi:MAG TPA: hypothetical protein VF453_13495 [Burkholderiaceae bacterium]